MEHVTPGVPTSQVLGVVVAAGAGRRMGTPKGLLLGPAGPLVAEAAITLSEGGCTRVAVVTGARAADVAALLPAPVIRLDNPRWEQGMSTSVARALKWAGETPADGLLILPVDTPGIRPEVISRIIEAFGQLTNPRTSAVQATYDGRPRNPVLLGAATYDSVAESLTGDEGARVWLSSNGAAVHRVECGDIGSPDDLDTPDQFDRWRRSDPADPSRR